MSRKNTDGEASTTKVIVMLMLAIAFFGWAFFAAAYAHSEEGWRQADSSTNVADPTAVGQDERMEDAGNIRRAKKSSLRDFIWNAFSQIPNVVSVISFNFANRLWLVILFACLEAGALGLGYAMSKID
ncbi:hypothetical protein Pan241w_22920 [Gimesia alba]|uniref:Uncharacterized protein n=1 Tax=Gimesia alba TaxID=2527973 RepID=A0A517REA3_9PLAN|nr:hypothetical protein [Gimesia alba]QDT42211.1 hypothetical protein Pan241w_22920 [Gimesia alba]